MGETRYRLRSQSDNKLLASPYFDNFTAAEKARQKKAKLKGLELDDLKIDVQEISDWKEIV